MAFFRDVTNELNGLYDFQNSRFDSKLFTVIMNVNRTPLSVAAKVKRIEREVRTILATSC